MPTQRPYGAVRTLVEQHGGTMTPRPNNGMGVRWVLELEGRTVEVLIPHAPKSAAELNVLDPLYKTLPGVVKPETWKDYSDTELVEHAFWQLVRLFQVDGK